MINHHIITQKLQERYAETANYRYVEVSRKLRAHQKRIQHKNYIKRFAKHPNLKTAWDLVAHIDNYIKDNKTILIMDTEYYPSPKFEMGQLGYVLIENQQASVYNFENYMIYPKKRPKFKHGETESLHDNIDTIKAHYDNADMVISYGASSGEKKAFNSTLSKFDISFPNDSNSIGDKSYIDLIWVFDDIINDEYVTKPSLRTLADRHAVIRNGMHNAGNDAYILYEVINKIRGE